MKLPTLTHREDPQFTSEARDAKVNGTARLMMLVDEKGLPRDIWLAVSRGYGLDESAEAAVHQYRFHPAEYDGQPVGYELEVEVNFETF